MLRKCFENIREKAPLIHNITNYVTVNDCANILLACGASPIMADDIEEVEEIASICGGLNINIGTLNQSTIPSMLAAGKAANRLGRPVVLDPVGIGASLLRRNTVLKLIEEIRFTVIKGNSSEIKALAEYLDITDKKDSINQSSRGVDASEGDAVTDNNLESSIIMAKGLAKKINTVIAITGPIDIVADGEKAYCIRNGNGLMESITGAGCQLSALMAASVTANQENCLEGAAAAVCAMGIAGDMASERMESCDGNASFQKYMIDSMFNLDGNEFERRVHYEVR